MIQRLRATLCLTLVLVGCTRADSPRDVPADSASVGVDSAGESRAKMGIPFDPATLNTGDSVGSLRVAKLDTRLASDGTVLGNARFSGELRLRGQTFRHPEFPDVRAVCFEADSASAARMPRWSGDTRRPWFCLDNSESAATLLALPGDVRPAEIIIDDFTIRRGESDEVNSARLVRTIARGTVTSSAYSPRTAQPVSAPDAERAARSIVSFLRGEGDFDPKLFADSVTLMVSPEGGSGSKRLSRNELRVRTNWVVASIKRHSLVPPRSLPNITTRFGVHFNCHEYPLATRYPALARLPHVGVKLSGNSAGSCLQSWNVTMVFSDTKKSPVLVAAVYDQWEW